jgi:hypothetical protein
MRKPPMDLIKNINYYGKHGGFVAIVDRILSTNPKPSVPTIKLLLDPILKVIDAKMCVYVLDKKILGNFIHGSMDEPSQRISVFIHVKSNRRRIQGKAQRILVHLCLGSA